MLLSRGVTLPFGSPDACMDLLNFSVTLLFCQFTAINFGRKFETFRGDGLGFDRRSFKSQPAASSQLFEHSMSTTMPRA
jgi:hypothetical protein